MIYVIIYVKKKKKRKIEKFKIRWNIIEIPWNVMKNGKKKNLIFHICFEIVEKIIKKNIWI